MYCTDLHKKWVVLRTIIYIKSTVKITLEKLGRKACGYIKPCLVCSNVIWDQILLKNDFSLDNKTSSPCGATTVEWPCYHGAMCHSGWDPEGEGGVNRSSPCLPGVHALASLLSPQAQHQRAWYSSRLWRTWLQLNCGSLAPTPLSRPNGTNTHSHLRQMNSKRPKQTIIKKMNNNNN